MNAREVFEKIEQIAATSSRNEKEELLKELASDEFGAWVLTQAYSPFITYGVTPPADAKGKGSLAFTREDAEPFLNDLALRKLTGNAAKESLSIVLEALNDYSAQLLIRILNKDLRCGINVKSVNNVMPGLITVFSVMRANKYDAKKVKQWPVLGEPKLDGYRVSFVCKDGNAGFFTRTGARIPALDCMIPAMMERAEKLYDACLNNAVVGKQALQDALDLAKILKTEDDKFNFVVDGEAMTGLFASAGALKRKEEQAEHAEFHIYDIMSYADFDAVGSVGHNQVARRRFAQHFANLEPSDVIHVVPLHVLMNDEHVQTVYEHYLNMPLATYLARGDAEREAELLKILIDEETGEPKGMEGLIVKIPSGRYDKKKSWNWMKLKAEETEDLRIVGFFNGERGKEFENTTGGLIVDRNGVQVRIGAGFSKKLRDELWALWQEDCKILGILPNVGFKPGHAIDPKYVKDDPYELLGRLVEVKFHEPTPDGSLRHPRFIRFRDDKDGEVESKEAA